jgi:hypothetical protein
MLRTLLQQLVNVLRRRWLPASTPYYCCPRCGTPLWPESQYGVLAEPYDPWCPACDGMH